MRVLQNCGKMEVRESPIEGFGVFAKEDIPAGTLLEECPLIMFPRYTNLAKNFFDFLKLNGWTNPKEVYLENLKNNLRFKDPEKYFFKWHPSHQLDSDSQFIVLPLGNGPLYNTSNTNNNADWKMQKDTFVFRAEKDIPKDTEITTFYGYFLSEDGASFNCENVFHMAIDMFGGEHKLKMLRFGSVETLNTQKNNPAAHKIYSLFLKAKDGLLIKRITLFNSNNQIIVNYDVPSNIPLSVIYQRLAEAKSHHAPLAQFQFQYTSNDKIELEEVLWKK